jgi:hypothetical protein
MKNQMKDTAAFRPAVFVVLRYVAVRAPKKTSETVVPMSRNVHLSKRSMYSAVQVLPMMVKFVQQAFSRQDLKHSSQERRRRARCNW